MKDSIFNAEKINAINELQTKYESEKSQKEIAILHHQNELADARLLNTQIIRNIILVTTLLIIGFLLFNYQSETKIQTKRISRQYRIGWLAIEGRYIGRRAK